MSAPLARESVRIPNLEIGDIVFVPYSGGVRLRIVERFDYADRTSFSTEYVDGDISTLGQYGRDMRDGNWRIQGNELASINRCV